MDHFVIHPPLMQQKEFHEEWYKFKKIRRITSI